MITARRGEAEESLEALEERVRREQAKEEDDAEVALADLEEALASRQRLPRESLPEERTGEEFTCSSCHLIYSRGCLGDEDRLLCVDCAREEEWRRRSRARRARPRIRTEAPCPACGEIVMVPEREDAACGFFCPGCGVHVRRWGGHLHLVWNHRQVPDRVASVPAKRGDVE